MTPVSPLTKINSKWIKDLNIRTETVKFQDENIGINLLNISLGNNFFWILHQKVQATKVKINNWDYIKLKNFCTGKKNPQNKKTTYGIRENIFKSSI